MTFFSVHDPLFKYAISWNLKKQQEWMDPVFNFYTAFVAENNGGLFPRSEISWKVPVKKTTIKGLDYFLQITWDVGFYKDHPRDDIVMVCWQTAKFVEKGSPPIEFYRTGDSRHWKEFYALLLRLFRTEKPEVKRYLYDLRVNTLNTALNTVRFEFIFGQGVPPCRICEESMDESGVCDECNAYCGISDSE